MAKQAGKQTTKQAGRQVVKQTSNNIGKNILKKVGTGLAMRAPIAGASALADSPFLPVGDIVGGVFLLGGIGMDIYNGYKEYKENDCENF